jgi:hypothetical protein
LKGYFVIIRKEAFMNKSIYLIVPVLLTSCAGMMPLVGLDKKGNTIMERVDEAAYSRRLADGLVSVQDSVVPALRVQSTGDTQWKLRTAVIGFGVKVEGGIGPFKVGVRPRIRAAFANGEKPPIP